MRINSRHLALITVGACAIAPANALARSELAAVTHNASTVAPCTRDYSLNSVSGGYCASDADSAAPITTPPLDAVTHNASAVAPCTRDYSLNSVSGGYCASDADSAAPITTPSLPTVIVKHDDGGFSWSDAGAGAGFTVALIAVATGGAIAFRRRSPSVRSHRSVATR